LSPAIFTDILNLEPLGFIFILKKLKYTNANAKFNFDFDLINYFRRRFTKYYTTVNRCSLAKILTVNSAAYSVKPINTHTDAITVALTDALTEWRQRNNGTCFAQGLQLLLCQKDLDASSDRKHSTKHLYSLHIHVYLDIHSYHCTARPKCAYAVA